MRRSAPMLALAAALLSPAHAIPPLSQTVRAARLFDHIRASPPRLRVFLQAMPKGGDLHHHLWGAVYAEDMLDEAAATGFCVTKEGSALLPPPCDPVTAVPAAGLSTRDPALYARTIDSLSMRGQPESTGAQAGHDRFFATFARFAPLAAQAPGRALAEARILAAGDHVSYLETQFNPAAFASLGAIAPDPADLAIAYARLAPLLPGLMARARAQTDDLERDAAARLGCAATASPPACAVLVRYQAYAVRIAPPRIVFAQLALAFALADADPRYVGVNLLAPEDDPVARADYGRHMAMIAFLHARHPHVRISLHAGELAPGLAPPAALRDHVARAVDAGATRIGHGVDIGGEADAAALLARMARGSVAVEINLSSNALILGVAGRDHPLALYRAAGVPTVLATDDEGVARGDMTAEYLRAALEQGLDYPALKAMARASLHFAFLPGDSLWRNGAIGTLGPACRAVDDAPTGACAALLARSERARAQWRLEAALHRFEANITHHPF